MTAPPSFFWHDYETFGTDARRDRPAQFAGIRTDMDFNPVGQPLVRYCQPVEDTLGHPEASLVTGITPQVALARGVPEPAFIADIVAEMAVPATTTVGYNNLRFDDEVTRHALWRNFFDPYAREWQNGCSRWDIIDMVRLAYALRPRGIQWPRREDGAPSFRLEDLARANGLVQEAAHDALSDVRATIALAQLVRDRQPRLYDYVLTHRDKRAAAAALDFDTRKPVLHVSQKFPAALGCLSPVMPIARDPGNRNAVIVYDLRIDPEALLTLPGNNIRERLFTPSQDLPDDAPRVGLKGVHLNKCPVLAPFDMLRDAEARRLSLDVAQCRRHWKAVRDRLPQIQAKVAAVFEARAFAGDGDAETALYDGFIPNADRKRADGVRRAAPADLAAGKIVFKDQRLNELLFRYRARYYPETLDENERADWNRWVAKRLAFAPDGGLTLDDFDAIIQALMAQARGEPARLRLLGDLRAWSERLRNRL